MELKLSSGATYNGEVNSLNQPHGFGKKTLASGDFFEGSFKNGKLNGSGSYMFNGEHYEGGFSEDCREGRGKCQYKGGACYDGEWENDKWNGEGILFLPNGDSIEALWLDNRIGTVATVRYNDGSTYEGPLKPLSFSTEEEYIIERIDNWLGEGTYTLPTGEKISGFWDDYKVSDSLVLLGLDNIPVKGYMRDGEFIKGEASELIFSPALSNTAINAQNAERATPNTDTYVGETNRRGEYHGTGRMEYASGEIYAGKWAYGDWYGYGLYVDKDGEQYYGFFSKRGTSQNIAKLDGTYVPHRGVMENGIFIKSEK